MANKIYRIKTISEFHKVRGLPAAPLHPLISLVDYSQVKHKSEDNNVSWVHSFYSIALKRNVVGKLRYGQQLYDFDEGLMSFIGPGQSLNVVVDETQSLHRPSGWILLVHPDFIWNTNLAKSIKQYGFFDYATNEALFLSEKEEGIIQGILENIKQEIETNIDKFSQNIIISQIELLLHYAERFYQRQFITRKINNHQILGQLEELLRAYFDGDDVVNKGLPTVQYVADKLNVSPNYLSGLLKSLTGQSTQQHIHEKLIEKAKEKLSTTTLSVSEIAYQLGFEHSQSFNKLFKAKANISPLEFRQSFN
jgi:AraC family transcriptional regulator, transcriptional activator of pobA